MVPGEASLSNEAKKMLFHGLAYLELFLNLTTYLITILCFYILFKSPMFHINLIRLIKCAIFYYTLSQIMRFVMIIGESTSRELLGKSFSVIS